jgi:hypothetical protein
MDLTARIEAMDAHACNLVGTSEVTMSGKAAAFGGRMMNSVADQVLKQFAANFAAKVQALQPPGSGGAASTTSAPATPAAGTAPAPTQLNALALGWAVIKDWLRSLFSPKRV